MKRSSMIMKIVQAHAEMDMLHPDGYDYKALAEHLLTKIEAAGMVPPEIETDLYDRANACNYYEHEWEPEDEH